MAGYTRQDTSNNIATGNVINAADLDNEFDTLAATYSVTTGHKHDGTAAEGPPITVVGPAQDIIVSSTGVTPKTTNVYDLGSSANKFKTAYIETATLTAGTVGGSAIVTLAGTQTLTNKTLTSPTISTANLTGVPVAPTAAAATNTTQVATTAFVFAERSNTATLTNKTLTSPTISAANLTGVPVAPTATAGTNTTQVATTAFVFAERTNTATLTNKTLTSPTINSATISTATITGSTLEGIYSGTFTIPTNGTLALPFDTSPVIRITPTASGAFTTTAPPAGTTCTLIVLTSGTTSYTMTFSTTGFRATGSLVTGTTSNRYFVLQFISTGSNLIEVSRTVAITG